MRDVDDPALLDYLRAENAAAERFFEPHLDTIETIFGEIRSRVQETDMSTPVEFGPWWYVTSTTEGMSYPAHHRGPTAERATEIVLLDENVEAEGHEFFELGAFDVSMDHRVVAWSMDVTGDEHYTLRFRDLTTGVDLDDRIDDTSNAGVAWSRDGQWVFYVTPDEQERPATVWRHRLGTPRSDDVLVFDFQSLYPTIMRSFNIDPLSYVRPGQPEPEGLDAIEAPNGARFRREPAILPSLLERFFDSRRQARERGDQVASFVYKIIMNSFYGVLGARGCRFAGSALAGAVTSFGQRILSWCRGLLERHGYTVLYGDTDSLFVRGGRSEADGICRLVNDALAEYLRGEYRIQPRLTLRFEKHYLRKEYLLFPYLERTGVSGPPKVMWGKHDEIRDLLRGSLDVLKTPGITREELNTAAKTAAGETIDQAQQDGRVSQERADRLDALLRRRLADAPVGILRGACVLEVRAAGVHKGLVVERVLARSVPSPAVVAIGDDETDEDMFAAVPEPGLTVHVGPGATRASARLEDWRAVRALLTMVTSGHVPDPGPTLSEESRG